jgi:hypothetical protein
MAFARPGKPPENPILWPDELSFSSSRISADASPALKGRMRNILLAIVVAVLPAALALADPPGHQKPDKHPSDGKSLPLKGTSTGNSCAAFGPGFVKVEGSDTCVRLGGGISIGAGASSGGR